MDQLSRNGEDVVEHGKRAVEDGAAQIRQKAKKAKQRFEETFDDAKRGTAPGEFEEGTVTRAIERYTSQLPSGAFLAAALGSMGVALALRSLGRWRDANLVAQLVPTVLIMGLYNKVVKHHGSD